MLNVRRVLQPGASSAVAPEQVTSTAQGTSLAQLVTLSARWGEPMRALRRQPSTGFVVPSVVHWKLNHYAALVAVETAASGERVYVLRDPTFGEDVRTTERWLDAEASGYVLVPSRLEAPASWTSVDESEAATVWGRGVTTGADPHNHGDRDLNPGSCPAPPRRGMAHHNYHTLAASLHVEDTPVWLNPAFGPEVELRVAYNQADSSQSQMPTTTSFGGRWTFNWQSTLQGHSDSLITHHMGGGGVAEQVEWAWACMGERPCCRGSRALRDLRRHRRKFGRLRGSYRRSRLRPPEDSSVAISPTVVHGRYTTNPRKFSIHGTWHSLCGPSTRACILRRLSVSSILSTSLGSLAAEESRVVG